MIGRHSGGPGRGRGEERTTEAAEREKKLRAGLSILLKPLLQLSSPGIWGHVGR